MTLNFNIRFGWLPSGSITADDLNQLEARIVSAISGPLADIKAAVDALRDRINSSDHIVTAEDLALAGQIKDSINELLAPPPTPEPPTPEPTPNP